MTNPHPDADRPGDESTADNSKSRIDPRLKPFLRQAHAIIAAERGLNTQCQLKLRSLADHLRLPDELYEAALKELEQANVTAALSSWENAFVKFLESEFAKITQGLVTVATETRAVELAKRKYQIGEVRARQLISRCAESLGLGRVEPEDARRHAHEMIVERIGDSVVVEDAMREKLYFAGKTWGVSPEDVDALVLKHLVANRKTYRNARLRKLSAVLAVLICVGAFVFVGSRLGWWERALSNLKQMTGTDPHELQPTEDVAESDAESNSICPRWWSEQVRFVATRLSDQSLEFNDLVLELGSEDAELRRVAFDGFVAWVVTQDTSSVAAEVFCEAWLTEPSSKVADHAIRKLLEFMKPSPDRLQLDREIERSFQAANFLAKLREASRQPERESVSANLSLLAQVFAESFSENRGNDERVDADSLKAQVAEDHWDHALRLTWKNASRASVLVQPLYELTKPYLSRSAQNRLRSRMIELILDVDSGRWKDMKDSIRGDIESANDVKVNRWIKLFRSATSESYRQFLGNLLVKKTGVTPVSSRIQDVELALAGIRGEFLNAKHEVWVGRNRLLDASIESVSRPTQLNQANIQADDIARVAWVTNGAIALAADEISGRTEAYFEKWVRTGVPNLSELYPDPLPSPADRPIAGTASASERRNRKESSEKLARTEELSMLARMSAFDQICRNAKQFDRISYADAEVVAKYLLGNWELEEWLNIEKGIRACRHWSQIKLAVADLIPQSQSSLDQVVTLYQLLTDETFQVESASDWRSQIKMSLLQNALAQLRVIESRRIREENSRWVSLKEYLRWLQQFRANSLGQQSKSDQTGLAVWAIVGGLIDHQLNDSPLDAVKINEFRATLDLIQNSEFGEMEKLVLANQTLADVSSQIILARMPALSWDVNDILLEYQRLSGGDANVAYRLYLSEYTLLQLWSLFRERLLQVRLELVD